MRRFFLTASLVVATISVASATDRPEEPESRGRLLVEQVVLKPGPDGGVIEVRFRLAGVDRLPGDPGETYVRDEESGTVSRVRRIPMLPASSSTDPAPSKIASFVVPNYGNKFVAGRPLTVVVAGLEQKGVILEAAEPHGGAPDTASQEPKPAPSAAKLTVLSLRTTANGDLLDVRYKLTGVERVSGDTKETYVIDPSTGERLGALGVSRVGLLSTKHVDKAGTSFLILQNPGKKIKAGDRVTVVISGARADDILVEP